jgi:proline iminopeptidase
VKENDGAVDNTRKVHGMMERVVRTVGSVHNPLRSLFFLAIVGILPLFGQSTDPGLRGKYGLLNVNGTELFTRTLGEGVPVVILHGGPGLDHTYLLPQFAELAKHHKLIFFDQRASGKSSSTVDTNSMTMDNFVEDVEGIRRAFNLEKMDLLGHSWGGLVAMFYAVKYPDHLNSLILANSTPASAALRNASFALMANRTSKEDSIAQVALYKTEGFRAKNSTTMDEFFRLLFRGTFYDRRYADSLTLTLDTSYATKGRVLRYLMRDRELAAYDLFARLNVIHCSTLIVGSDYDMVAPEANEKIHWNIPGSTLVVLKKCGHFPFVESSKEFFGAIESFLEKTAKQQ